jgi:hypothetical protein
VQQGLDVSARLPGLQRCFALAHKSVLEYQELQLGSLLAEDELVGQRSIYSSDDYSPPMNLSVEYLDQLLTPEYAML